jgi:hypothetical protein
MISKPESELGPARYEFSSGVSRDLDGQLQGFCIGPPMIGSFPWPILASTRSAFGLLLGERHMGGWMRPLVLGPRAGDL